MTLGRLTIAGILVLSCSGAGCGADDVAEDAPGTREAGEDVLSEVAPPVSYATGSACGSKAPETFTLNTRIGGGAGARKESAHFAIFGGGDTQSVLNGLEGAHKCFIEDWCFRSPGLSIKAQDSGPYYKTNFYSDAVMNAGGLTYWDGGSGLSYVHVLTRQMVDVKTPVHEYGHAITMSENTWMDQKRTGFWWETVANWVAYTFMTSDYCAAGRAQANIKPATTLIDQMHTLTTVYGLAHTVICNDQNYYQAWPFLTYLTNNPDSYPGLGKMAVADLMRKYQKGSNETPLHTLNRIAAPVTTQTILGRYWARMAYFDIGLPVGQKDFLSTRGALKFGANLDGANGSYTVKTARKPQYGGANITPLRLTGGDVKVTVSNAGNGQADSGFTATLAIRAQTGEVRYVDLPGGTGQATVSTGEEASLVVVNTPKTLIQFDPQYIKSPENVGLSYKVTLSGAVPAG